MDAKKSKSKKPSATKVKQLSLDEVTFFLDRCIEMKTVVQRLNKEGMKLELHSKHYRPEEEDQYWLKKASENNWVTITKDEMIGKRPYERDSLLSARGRAFIVCADDLKADEVADIIILSLTEILRLLARYPDMTFIAKISKDTKVRIWKTERHLFS